MIAPEPGPGGAASAPAVLARRVALTTAERYAGLSIGQIKDVRKTKQIAREPGHVRLQLTLRPDQIATSKAAARSP